MVCHIVSFQCVASVYQLDPNSNCLLYTDCSTTAPRSGQVTYSVILRTLMC